MSLIPWFHNLANTCVAV